MNSTADTALPTRRSGQAAPDESPWVVQRKMSQSPWPALLFPNEKLSCWLHESGSWRTNQRFAPPQMPTRIGVCGKHWCSASPPAAAPHDAARRGASASMYALVGHRRRAAPPSEGSATSLRTERREGGGTGEKERSRSRGRYQVDRGPPPNMNMSSRGKVEKGKRESRKHARMNMYIGAHTRRRHPLQSRRLCRTRVEIVEPPSDCLLVSRRRCRHYWTKGKGKIMNIDPF